MTQEEIASVANEIIEAASYFKYLANDLVRNLERKIKKSINEIPFVKKHRLFYELSLLDEEAQVNFWDKINAELDDRNFEQKGDLDEHWQYFFHGQECMFKHRVLGQVVNVKLGFGEEFGCLDPYFFSNFILTTPYQFENLKKMIHHEFNDGHVMINYLYEQGRLEEVQSYNINRKGLVKS